MDKQLKDCIGEQVFVNCWRGIGVRGRLIYVGDSKCVVVGGGGSNSEWIEVVEKAETFVEETEALMKAQRESSAGLSKAHEKFNDVAQRLNRVMEKAAAPKAEEAVEAK